MSYLTETPPYCPTAECYVHGRKWNDIEHHVEGCPLAGTLANQSHLMSHAFQDFADSVGMAVLPAMEKVQDAMREFWRSLPWATRTRIRIEVAWERLVERIRG